MNRKIKKLFNIRLINRILFGIIKFILATIVFFVSAIFMVILILGLWFINQADYKTVEEQAEKKSQNLAIQDNHSEPKLNVSKLPSDDQQELINSKLIKRTIFKNDGKILQAIKYLNFVEKLQLEIETSTTQPICKLICSSSGLDQERMANDPYLYVEKFYIQNRSRAIDDFYFRHSVEAARVVSLILTPRMREMYIDGLEIESKSYLDQAIYVTKFQFAAAQALYNISQLNKKFQNHEKKMAKLIELRITCDYTSAKKVQQSCADMLDSSEEPVLDPKIVARVKPASSDDEDVLGSSEGDAHFKQTPAPNQELELELEEN